VEEAGWKSNEVMNRSPERERHLPLAALLKNDDRHCEEASLGHASHMIITEVCNEERCPNAVEKCPRVRRGGQ